VRRRGSVRACTALLCAGWRWGVIGGCQQAASGVVGPSPLLSSAASPCRAAA
jgi:hypothetical protein